MPCHLQTERGALVTIARTLDALQWQWGQRGTEYLLGQGIALGTGFQWLFGVVNHGCSVVGHFVEEALQVGVIHDLDGVREEVVDNKKTKTEGGGGYIITNTQPKHNHTQLKKLSQTRLLYFARLYNSMYM